MATSPTSLSSTRFRQLLAQLKDEIGYGWQTEAARRLGIHQTMVSKVYGSGRAVGIQSIERAIERLNLDKDFFFDPALKDPDYRDYVRSTSSRREARPETTELDADRGTINIEAYLEQEGAHLSAGMQRKLRGLRWSEGDLPIEAIRALVGGLLAAEAGKAAREAADDEVDVRPGARKLR